MNAVVYYSKTNESKKIAEYFSKKLNYNIIDIEIIDMFNFNNLILAFPVHCQNIPNPVKLFLNNIKVNNLTINKIFYDPTLTAIPYILRYNMSSNNNNESLEVKCTKDNIYEKDILENNYQFEFDSIFPDKK